MNDAPSTHPAPPRPARRRTYIDMVIARTLAGPGARLGAIWIGLLIGLACLAPLIANSHPYILKRTTGEIEFPLFRFLRPVDVILLVLLVCGGVLWFLTALSRPKRWLIFLAITAITIPVCFLTVDPPIREVFQTYRQAEAAGEIEWMIEPPIAYSPRDRQRDRVEDRRYVEPSLKFWEDDRHLFGTDGNRADVAASVLFGSRVALSVGFVATGIALLIGVVIGGLMGYFIRWVDLLGMRLVEIFSAIPGLLLMLIIAAVIPPEWNPYRLYIMMVIIGVTGWVGYARFTRAEFLKLRDMDYVQAARAAGLPLRSILFKHMLPNGVAPVLVETSFGVAGAILAESTLSFLGLGLIDDPSWGRMLSESITAVGSFKWWMAVFPGNAIFLTVLAYVLIGEALRDAIDPYTQKASQF